MDMCHFKHGVSHLAACQIELPTRRSPNQTGVADEGRREGPQALTIPSVSAPTQSAAHLPGALEAVHERRGRQAEGDRPLFGALSYRQLHRELAGKHQELPPAHLGCEDAMSI